MFLLGTTEPARSFISRDHHFTELSQDSCAKEVSEAHESFNLISANDSLKISRKMCIGFYSGDFTRGNGTGGEGIFGEQWADEVREAVDFY